MKIIAFMGFEDTRNLFESWIVHQVVEALATDMSFADVSVAVSMASQWVLTVIKMNGVKANQSDLRVKSINRLFVSLTGAEPVACGEIGRAHV